MKRNIWYSSNEILSLIETRAIFVMLELQECEEIDHKNFKLG